MGSLPRQPNPKEKTMQTFFKTTDEDLISTLIETALELSPEIRALVDYTKPYIGNEPPKTWELIKNIEVSVKDASMKIEISERGGKGYPLGIQVQINGDREVIMDHFLKYRRLAWGYDWTPYWEVTDLTYETNRPHLLWCQSQEDAAEAFFQNDDYGTDSYLATLPVIKELTVELSRLDPRSNWRDWAQMRYEEEMEDTDPLSLPQNFLQKLGYGSNVEV